MDAPYSNDLFLDEAFRYPIGFPDDVFPEAWKGVFLSPMPGVVSLEATEETGEEVAPLGANDETLEFSPVNDPILY